MQINFDTPPRSYWMDSVKFSNYEKLNSNIKTDVAVVGGGIAGILTAYLLSRQGVKVTIFEADKILRGTIGHTTAKITSLHDLRYQKIDQLMSREFARQYADANETAIRMIRSIAEENNIDCDLNTESSYVFTQRDDYIEKIEKEAKIASELGIAASYTDKIPLSINIKAAVRFDNQARFHPLKFLLPLSEKIISGGSQIYEQTRIADLEIENNAFILKTADEYKITADKVIIASHYPFYNKAGFYFARLYPERSYVIAVKAAEKYPGGMYINAEDPARSIRSQETENNEELYLIGGEHHKTGQGEDTINHYKALADFANQHFTVKDIVCRWSTQDCMSIDDVPLTGQFVSEIPNLFVATGFNKWGMTNSMASAILLKDIILNIPNSWKDVYSPSRHTIMASIKNFVVENANVAKELIKGKLESIDDDIDIKPGEGKVVEINEQRAGAYRDEEGKLHIVNTTCTHMGCELNWNSAEKSWDCPCHGSRFSFEGDVIEGPAVRRLDLHEHTNTFGKIIKDEF